MVTTRNAKRASSITCSKEVENLEPNTNKDNSIIFQHSKRNVVKESLKRQKQTARTPLRENVSQEGQSDKAKESRTRQNEEVKVMKGGEFLEKHPDDVVPLLEPHSLPIWDPVDNWFDETKTSNVKKTFSRKHSLLR
ncbi:hypothetical protein GpartN1_g488.t1 [Galdieria partita]|uniref:Uncharacterized protein n=1 Tax=Galdieria partita TaxID=83374 RepID=A0A9C7PS52_9RHOD|nr:hypothetical protein GpartN1_g488.t1 [Galdieria partita]